LDGQVEDAGRVVCHHEREGCQIGNEVPHQDRKVQNIKRYTRHNNCNWKYILIEGCAWREISFISQRVFLDNKSDIPAKKVFHMLKPVAPDDTSHVNCPSKAEPVHTGSPPPEVPRQAKLPLMAMPL
jgi:hypothetical protein